MPASTNRNRYQKRGVVTHLLCLALYLAYDVCLPFYRFTAALKLNLSMHLQSRRAMSISEEEDTSQHVVIDIDKPCGENEAHPHPS